jgi:radical SAM-linked protein
MERLLIKFTKNKEAKYISHLDTLRTLHRAFRRADLPIAYSKGFNPHASISIAAPLSLGIGSNAEYADIELESYVEGNIVMEKLNSALPNGIRILKVININKKMPSSMAIVEGAKYIIGLNHKTDKNSINAIITSILNSEDIMMLKKTKSGEKMVKVDLK